jgi:hypothetical protein
MGWLLLCAVLLVALVQDGQVQDTSGPYFRDPITGFKADGLKWLNSTFSKNQTNALFGLERTGLILVVLELTSATDNLMMVDPVAADFPEVVSQGQTVIKNGQASTTYAPPSQSYAPQFLAFLFAKDDAQARQLVDYYQQHLDEYRARTDIAQDDVAQAMADRAQVDIECADPASGRRVLSEQEQHALNDRMHESLVRSAFAQGLSDDYRQLQAELSILERWEIDTGCTQALELGDAESFKKVKDYVANDMKKLSLD